MLKTKKRKLEKNKIKETERQRDGIVEILQNLFVTIRIMFGTKCDFEEGGIYVFFFKKILKLKYYIILVYA